MKCDPELAIELREQHSEVTPAWHFNKQHWNGIDLKGSVPEDLLKEWINHAYDIVVKGLKKADRDSLKKS